MEKVILRGEIPKVENFNSGSGSGYGSGYGYGYGDSDGDGDGNDNGYGYGYGYDNGYGYGYGYGEGDGSGDGYGDGSGYGNGSGDGSGSGYGNGYGYGYGSGYGNGYGYGYGYSYGYGYGLEEYWFASISYFKKKWPATQQQRLAKLIEIGTMIAFWCSHHNGLPANGGSGIEPAAPGIVHTAPGPLDLCNKGTLHATLQPQKWKGEQCWIVALHGEVIGDEEKYGCLRREIIGEAR